MWLECLLRNNQDVWYRRVTFNGADGVSSTGFRQKKNHHISEHAHARMVLVCQGYTRSSLRKGIAVNKGRRNVPQSENGCTEGGPTHVFMNGRG